MIDSLIAYIKSLRIYNLISQIKNEIFTLFTNKNNLMETLIILLKALSVYIFISSQAAHLPVLVNVFLATTVLYSLNHSYSKDPVLKNFSYGDTDRMLVVIGCIFTGLYTGFFYTKIITGVISSLLQIHTSNKIFMSVWGIMTLISSHYELNNSFPLFGDQGATLYKAKSLTSNIQDYLCLIVSMLFMINFDNSFYFQSIGTQNILIFSLLNIVYYFNIWHNNLYKDNTLMQTFLFTLFVIRHAIYANIELIFIKNLGIVSAPARYIMTSFMFISKYWNDYNLINNNVTNHSKIQEPNREIETKGILRLISDFANTIFHIDLDKRRN